MSSTCIDSHFDEARRARYRRRLECYPSCVGDPARKARCAGSSERRNACRAGRRPLLAKRRSAAIVGYFPRDARNSCSNSPYAKRKTERRTTFVLMEGMALGSNGFRCNHCVHRNAWKRVRESRSFLPASITAMEKSTHSGERANITQKEICKRFDRRDDTCRRGGRWTAEQE